MSELRAFDDLDPFGAETEDELEDLIQDCYHRLIETPGSNLDDPSRGLGIEDALSGPLDPFLQTRIENELTKDARVIAAKATLTEVETGSYRIDIVIVVNEGELNLTLATDADGNVYRVKQDGAFR